MLPPMEFDIQGVLSYFPVIFAVSLLNSSVADVKSDVPQMLPSLTLTSRLRGRELLFHFSDKEAADQESLVTCPKPHS